MYAFTQRKHDPGKINKNNFLLHPENGNCKTRLAYENFFQFYDLLYLKN